MPTRIPLDVDLEDRLLYGLTPTRLVYLVIAFVAAFSVWSTRWSPPPVRGACAVLIAALGAAAAWSRWRGRSLDAWAADVALYCVATYRLRLEPPRWLARLTFRR